MHGLWLSRCQRKSQYNDLMNNQLMCQYNFGGRLAG